MFNTFRKILYISTLWSVWGEEWHVDFVIQIRLRISIRWSWSNPFRQSLRHRLHPTDDVRVCNGIIFVCVRLDSNKVPFISAMIKDKAFVRPKKRRRWNCCVVGFFNRIWNVAICTNGSVLIPLSVISDFITQKSNVTTSIIKWKNCTEGIFIKTLESNGFVKVY